MSALIRQTSRAEMPLSKTGRTGGGGMMRWRAWIGCLAILALIAGCHKATSSTTTTVAINISAATVAVGGTVSFAAQVNTAASDMTVTWQVDSVTGGDSTHGTIDT